MKKQKKILIIYTGGTIGMQKTDHGLSPQKERFHRQLEEIPELYAGEMPLWEIIDMDPLLDSSNIAVREWNEIGQMIAQNYAVYDGFIVLHGTDTMAYTASALSFMLKNNTKPVILTGSQIPLCEIRNDARDNLITALLLAADDRIHEVCLYFGGKLLRGNRSSKFSADDLIAFDSPNYLPLAEAGIEIRFREEGLLKSPDGPFSLQLLKEIPIGVIKVFPGIQFELFDPIMTEKLKGVVIETFGAGNIPGNADQLLPIIEKAAKNGTIIIVCSQCPHGRVSLGTYETSSQLRSAGAVSGYDITTEAAVAKLYYLFSRGLSREGIIDRMEMSIRGEMTIRQ
ncbi:MAG: asparaginase [Parasporobacterium sp.]|nr:asparaginase [Parasporobacterium sp.]